jgi:hypothetical protein
MIRTGVTGSYLYFLEMASRGQIFLDRRFLGCYMGREKGEEILIWKINLANEKG